ncbi:MAG TPA: tRNA (guanosine(37)-N1)-methyltransferase TrmD [Chloroflexota bacterium]|jgi:tRNA (guanine37-N1)-methyltransferase|nr:tRNA (guanosine(37)-N1)-methyltransferase TrmD [Chloroflexota bacterium]
MRIDILTLFPGMFSGPLSESIIGRAQSQGIVEIGLTDIRSFATDRHHTVDDTPYGGGPGMVMKAPTVADAIESVQSPQARVILLSPQGRVLTQSVARELAGLEHLVLVCGHYEGIDERVRELLVDDEMSIGDYVLTGGELPAMVLVDAVVRLIPGALGDDASSTDESHADGLLEYPHYTRPPEFRGREIPAVLLSGNHAHIAQWRRYQSLLRTRDRRPDLFTPRHQVELAELEARLKKAGVLSHP